MGLIFKNFFLDYLIKYPFLKQFIKFCLVGGSSAVISFSIYYSATEWLKIWYVYSAIFAFLISAVFNFTSNKLWTFRNTEKGKQILNQITKFAVVMVSGLIINTVIIYGLTEWVGFDYRISWVFAAGAVAFWSFGFHRLWTFKYIQYENKEEK